MAANGVALPIYNRLSIMPSLSRSPPCWDQQACCYASGKWRSGRGIPFGKMVNKGTIRLYHCP